MRFQFRNVGAADGGQVQVTDCGYMFKERTSCVKKLISCFINKFWCIFAEEFEQKLLSNFDSCQI